MLKKLSAVLMSFAVGIGTAAFAAPAVEVADVISDTLKVSGDAAKGAYVSILVTNPGFTYEQALVGENGAVLYFGGARAKNDGYSFEIPISGAVGGSFGIYTDIDGAMENTEFIYYTSDFKLTNIKALNRAETKADIKAVLDKTMNIFSMSQNPLYTKGDTDQIAKSILDVRAGLSGKAFPEEMANLDNVVSSIEDALILAAYNAGKEELVTENKRLKFAEKMSVTSTDEYKDYSQSLSDEGVANVNKGMLKNDFTSYEDAKEKFSELVYFNVLMNYSSKGYGHIQNYFEKYEDAYKEAGFDIPSKADRELYLDMLDLDSDTLTDLAKDFNRLKKGGSSGGSGSGGSGFAGGGSGVSTAPTPNTSTGDAPVSYLPAENTSDIGSAQGSAFSDVSQSHWAYEPIKTLSDKKIITGYEDGSFCPSGSITRAEFAAIMQRAFNIAGSGESFVDVQPGEWYFDAVSALSAKGLIKGSDGRFDPQSSIKREDAALIIYRYLGSPTDPKAVFEDIDTVSDYAKEAVASLADLGIINGYKDGTFRPKDSISRAEAAKIIYTCITKEAV